MGVCGEKTRFGLCWCVLSEDHGGGHRGTIGFTTGNSDLPDRAVLSWSHDDADPIIVEVR